MENEDEQRVKQRVQHRANQHRQHPRLGEALRGDERVQAERQLHEHRAEAVNGNIALSVGQGILRCAERQQNRRVEAGKHNRQHCRNAQQQRRAAAQNPLRLLVVPLPHRDGRKRRAAGCAQRRERRNQQDNRQADAQPRQCERAHVGNVADVDAVDKVIEHIDELRGDGGNRQAQHQPPDGFICEVGAARCSGHRKPPFL